MTPRSALFATAAAVFAGSVLLGPAASAAEPGSPALPHAKLHPSLHKLPSAAVPAKVWVYFTDKGPGDHAEAYALLSETYPAAALERRRLRRTARGLFDQRDLPIPASYIAAVEAAGPRVLVQSNWLNAVSVRADARGLVQLAALPFVQRIEPVRRARRLEPVLVRALPAPDAGLPGGHRGPPPYHGLAETQLAQIGVTTLHDLGFTGEGIRIAVLDTGFNRAHNAFSGPEFPLSVIAEWDFINADANTGPEPGDPDGQADHGTYILGSLAAHAPGAYVGAAYRASYILCKTENVASETPIEEDNYIAALAFAEMHGADMVTASLAYYDWYTQDDFDGLTAVTTIGVNTATQNGVVCLAPAGNRGHDADPLTSTISAPGDALQVITCGAIQGNGQTSWFSSDGPSADGRVKPEVLARGSQTATVSPSDPANYVEVSGTSISTPLVAGAVACLLQARPAWTVDHFRAYLYTTADGYLATGGTDPLFIRGYGLINAAAAHMQDCDASGTDDAAEIASGLLPDCNANGIPDGCDLAAGISTDADGDTIPDECATCTADWNGDTVVNSTDISDFLTTWLASVTGGTLEGDVDGNNQVNSTDISAFLTAWLMAIVAGC